MPFRKPLGILEQYYASQNTENIPPSTAKPFELHPTWTRPEIGPYTYPRKDLDDYFRQGLLDGWEKEHAKDIITTEWQKFISAARRNTAAEWYHLKFGALDHGETRAVKKAARCCWEEALPRLRLRFEADIKQWEVDVVNKAEAVDACIREFEKNEKKLSNLDVDYYHRPVQVKLQKEISFGKRIAEDRAKELEDLQEVVPKKFKSRGKDLGIVWRRFDPLKKNKEESAAKRTGRKTPATRQSSQESPIPVCNVTTGTTEYGRDHSKTEAVQITNPRKRKSGLTPR